MTVNDYSAVARLWEAWPSREGRGFHGGAEVLRTRRMGSSSVTVRGAFGAAIRSASRATASLPMSR